MLEFQFSNMKSTQYIPNMTKTGKHSNVLVYGTSF